MVEGSKPVEVWGGIECTINRVRHTYLDQLHFAGHYTREKDIELLCSLGIKRLRYPVIWEKHQPTQNKTIEWGSIERNLNRLRELGVEPIAGLVHHGSGPKYASIETDDFATGLAKYASLVAEKFPWINYYTPVNEPLTTARFCGLYGHWHPHQKDNTSFLKLLINECKATVLAMEAIRKINPNAKLVQTEDLSRTYSTPLLKYQADFENHRRWLGFDLIMGKVDSGHPLWSFLLWSGISEAELGFFKLKNCPVDILGFNYYPTSERFLDENLQKYPESSHGGNHLHKYADVEAVRVDLDEEEYGAKLLLKEAWDRFKIPIAVTEVHLGCTRDEQMRWLKNIYTTCCELKQEGANILAITAWSMLGSYGWNKLLTSKNVEYEPGIFDLRSPHPRPTALAGMLKHLADGREFHHPVLEEKGWWKKDIRVLYFQNNIRRLNTENRGSQPLLIIGKTGTLGRSFARICDLRGIHYLLLSRQEFNLADPSQIEKVIAEKKPWAIINAAGFVRVDDAEISSNDCYIANTQGPLNLALLSEKYNFKLLTFSSDLVFDGRKNSSYTESDPVSPLNVYGRSKALAEKLVSEKAPSSLIIRTSAFFSPWDDYNFVTNVLTSLKNKTSFTAANDIFVSPTYVPDLVNASLDLLLDDESGIWHLANQGSITWAQLAIEVAKYANVNPSMVIGVPNKKLNLAAKRPQYSVLHSEKGLLLPSLSHALGNYFENQTIIDLSAPASETA
ncbi:family 1 glycosylhydrolase [Desertivirga xinjiangensis]|uniref:family 1 glycosylhydrolase n=1 Tax=Desertivirga xinjiangensis TaxID=539206 RepID=UPI002108F97B|nr:family 1 glycosylhydrolase [Pedobacter xinjiangensis]